MLAPLKPTQANKCHTHAQGRNECSQIRGLAHHTRSSRGVSGKLLSHACQSVHQLFPPQLVRNRSNEIIGPTHCTTTIRQKLDRNLNRRQIALNNLIPMPWLPRQQISSHSTQASTQNITGNITLPEPFTNSIRKQRNLTKRPRP